MFTSTTLLHGICISLGAFMLRKFYCARDSPYPLAPSPRYFPVIGHLLSLPSRDEHAGFMEMAKKLGNLFSLHIFGTPVLVVNSSQDAINLLEKRSNLYSDRVCPTMLSQPSLTNWGKFVGFLNYNERWKRSRRLMRPWLHKEAVQSLHSSHPIQTRLLLHRLLLLPGHLSTSESLEAEIYKAISATLAHHVYGYEAESHDDPFLLNLREATNNFITAALPSNFMVNLFPALIHIPTWFPGAGWKRTAQQWRKQKEHAIDAVYDWTKIQMAKGECGPSMVSSLLNDSERLGLDSDEIDDYVKHLAVTLFVAGPDTIASALVVFVLAMLLFPDVQKKAQQEIDAVVALNRLPVMSDRENLKYIDRLIDEVLRWRPIAPLGT
ncbi:hypothetical protein FRC12_000815 [Ceratobasidium sp. 428]|nr:hypothetical protein FRC12_000815 [Ceratobasidium sp. 428]